MASCPAVPGKLQSEDGSERLRHPLGHVDLLILRGAVSTGAIALCLGAVDLGHVPVRRAWKLRERGEPSLDRSKVRGVDEDTIRPRVPDARRVDEVEVGLSLLNGLIRSARDSIEAGRRCLPDHLLCCLMMDIALR